MDIPEEFEVFSGTPTNVKAAVQSWLKAKNVRIVSRNQSESQGPLGHLLTVTVWFQRLAPRPKQAEVPIILGRQIR